MVCKYSPVSPAYYRGVLFELEPSVISNGYERKLVNLLNYSLLFSCTSECKTSVEDQ